MKHRYLIAGILALLTMQDSSAQQTAKPPVPAPADLIQPKIIVIPRVKDGEDMKTMYDSDMNVQLALSKINEAFIKENANIVQFAAYLNEQKTNTILTGPGSNQEDIKTTVLRMSGCDIYVEAKLNIVNHASLNASSVTIILEGFQNGTGNLLGSKIGTSRINKTQDIGILVMQAMDSITKSFLALMQEKFTAILEGGQSVYLELSIGENSKQDFDAEIPAKNKFLAEVIEEWVRANAVKGKANSQGIVNKKMIYSDVRIPLRNPTNKDMNYTGQNYKFDVLRFLKSIGIQAKSDFSTNNKILITIQ
jgi:hypothetical protein